MRLRLTFTLLLVLALVPGCSGTKTVAKKTTEEPGDHEHGEGPHKGTVADLSSGKHLEFTVDHKTKEVRVYILDSKAKNDYPIKAEKMTLNITRPKFTIELKPEKRGDDGKVTCFVGKDDRFGVEQEFAGTINVVVEGKPWSGDFEEKARLDEKR